MAIFKVNLDQPVAAWFIQERTKRE